MNTSQACFTLFADADWTEIARHLTAAAIVLIIFGAITSIPITIFYLRYRAKRDLTKAWHEQRLAAIDKGIELPPIPEGLLNGGPQPVRPPRPPTDWSRWPLLFGLVFLGIGLGIRFAFNPTADQLARHDPYDVQAWLNLAHFGTVLASLGAGLFAFWLFCNARKRRDQTEATE